LVLFRKFKERAKVWLAGFAESRYARLIIFIHSIIDSSIFPLAVDFSVIPFSIARPKRAFQFAIWASLGTIIGGVLAYRIGEHLMLTFGSSLITFLNAESSWEYVMNAFNNGIAEVFIIIASITPISFTLAAIGAGAVKMNFYSFLTVVIVFRTLRFLALALLIYKYGKDVKIFLDKYEGLLLWFFLVVIILIVLFFIIFK